MIIETTVLCPAQGEGSEANLIKAFSPTYGCQTLKGGGRLVCDDNLMARRACIWIVLFVAWLIYFFASPPLPAWLNMCYYSTVCSNVHVLCWGRYSMFRICFCKQQVIHCLGYTSGKTTTLFFTSVGTRTCAASSVGVVICLRSYISNNACRIF